MSVKPKFHLARHVTSGHNRFDMSRQSISAVSSSACHTARLHTLVSRARHVEHVVLRCDEQSGIWTLPLKAANVKCKPATYRQ